MDTLRPDVLVIGSGQAGVPLAVRLAGAGRSVVLVERGDLGGTCVNTGCTPTKSMIASARAAHVARTAGRLGVCTRGVAVDLAAVVDRKDAIVRRWRDGVARRLESAGDRLHLVRGHARFVEPRTVIVDGVRITAETVVLDIGARAATPQLTGLATVPHVSNTGALALRDVPAQLLVLGGGYVGCELGQMFRRFGAEVTVVDPNPHLLAREDPEVSTALEEALTAEGIRLELSCAAESVRTCESSIVLRLANGREVRGSQLLVATGRRPNTDDLGCDAAGIELDARGFVVIDDGYATSAPGVYAVGDVAGGPEFTHSAWDDHRILFERLVDGSTRGRSSRLIPFVVFTDPQIGGVGLSEKQARARGVEYELATMPFGDIARAIEIDERRGVMRLLVDPKSERILGARLVGAEAGELVHVLVALMAADASVRAIVRAEAAHPTFAEGLQSLVMRLRRFALA